MAEEDVFELIEAFLADEDAAFAEGVVGQFWSSNHHRIRPLVGRIADLLDSDARPAFYLYFMCRTGEIPAVSEDELPFLIDGYRRLLPFIDQPDKAHLARRHVMLFAFGFDESGALASGETRSAKELKARLKLLTQTSKYTSLPAQWEKRANFLPFASEAERLLQTFRHLGYRHDRRFGDELYDIMNLTFWGMVLIVLSNELTRADLLHDMLNGDYGLMQRDKHLGIFHKAVRAVVADTEPEDIRFRDLADRLAAIEAARREVTETVALARTLNLPFDKDGDWEVTVSLAESGSGRSPLFPPNLVLLMRPDPDDPWHIRVTHSQRGRFSEWDGRITQNDLKIPGLGKGNLTLFPVWVRTMLEEFGLTFDLSTADVRAGRKRDAAKRIASWLGG